MKIGMTSLTFRNHSIEEVIRIAKAAGLDGMEWAVREDHAVSEENIDKIKFLSAKEGIEIFSLGSYCRMTDEEECKKTVDMAVRLSAPVIRIWAGKKSPSDCSEEEFERVVDLTKKMAAYAGKFGITLGFEFHKYTLTETGESAVRLIKAIDRENVKLYWQINERVSFEVNRKNLQMVTPYLAGIFHCQNYSMEGKCLLLEHISDELEEYLKPFLNTDYKTLVEFVKDGKEENFYQDVAVLKRIMMK